MYILRLKKEENVCEIKKRKNLQPFIIENLITFCIVFVLDTRDNVTPLVV
jgi:hypothetical protein